MSERAELICRMMVELGAVFEDLAEATTHQQRPEHIDVDAISAIASCAREAASIAEAASLLACRDRQAQGLTSRPAQS